MKIVCPACKKPIPGADIDLPARTAVCRDCGEVVAFGQLLAASEIAAPSVATEAKPLGPPLRPSDMRWSEHRDGAAHVFAISPVRWLAFPILGFAAAWDAFLVVWYGIAFSNGGGPGGLMLWFPLLHVAAGIFITYTGLCFLVNKTVLRFDAQRLVARHRPLPRGRTVSEPTDTLRRFEAGPRGSRIPGARTQNDEQTSWTVRATTSDGRSVDLNLELTQELHAQFVASRLTSCLDEIRAPHGYRD